MHSAKTIFSLILTTCAYTLIAEEAPLAGFKTVEDVSNLHILTPSLSQREYCKIILDNGLQAYLISDSEARQSAAALAVESGSWNDPKEYPGMAHFLEHMLFMGTEAYPKEFEYMQYITDHGGKVNASTWPDRTLYMFSINSEAFPEALDRFSHFFIDPLFSTSSINRELLAVDQEHSKNIENDDWREYMIFKETGNPDHPNASFSTGNAKTLSGIPQTALKKWYHDNYSANLMHLIVLSPLPMDQLQQQVRTFFSKVPNYKINPSKFTESLSSSQQKGSITYINPIRDRRRLSLTWEIPREFTQDKGAKLPEIIAYALGHEGTQSLSAELKRENIAEEVKVSAEWLSKHEAFLRIDIDLTSEGVAQKNTAILRCFEALALLKSKGVPQDIFEEMRTLALLKYQYQERQDPFEFVFQHAHDMVDENLDTYPSETLMPLSYDPKAILGLLQTLIPQDCMVTLQADPSLTGVFPEHHEKWMNAEYAVQPLSQEFISKLVSVKPSPLIALPSPNPFIPHNLNLIAHDVTKDSNQPTLISDDAQGKIYFLQDNEYHVPQVSAQIAIKTPLIDGSSRSTAMGDLFLKALTDQIADMLHNAATAGFSVDFAVKSLKLQIEVNGFSDKAPVFLNALFTKMKSLSITPQQFQTYRQALLSEYDDGSKDLPVKQAIEFTSSIIFRDSSTKEDRAKALERITFDEFTQFSNKLLSKGYLEGFFYGNLDENGARAILSSITQELQMEAYPSSEQAKRFFLVLPDKQGPFMIVRNTSRQGYGVVLCIEQGGFSFERRATQQILSRALADAFFDTLRTKQQTAYFARSWDQEVERQLMQLFAVQSSSHHPQELLARFELFLEDFSRSLNEKIPQERFETMREMLVQNLETPPENMQAMAQRLNLLAFEYVGDFDWYEKRVQTVKSLQYEQFQKTAQQFISRDNSRRIAILFEGVVPPEKDFRYERVSKEDICDLGTYSSFR